MCGSADGAEVPLCCHALSNDVRAFVPPAPVNCEWSFCSSSNACAGSALAAFFSTESMSAPASALPPGELARGAPARDCSADADAGRPLSAEARLTAALAPFSLRPPRPRSGGTPFESVVVEVAAAGAGAEASGALAVAPEVGGSGAVGGRWRGDGRRPLIVAEEVDDVGWVWGRPPRGDGGLLFAPPGRGDESRWLLVAPGRGEESRRSPPGRGEEERGLELRMGRHEIGRASHFGLLTSFAAAFRIVGETCRPGCVYQPHKGPLSIARRPHHAKRSE